MQPTFKAVIEKPSHLAIEEVNDVPYVDVDSMPLPPPPSSPVEVKKEKCCSVTTEPPISELLQALGSAFLIGALTGGLLAYSFSKSTVIVSDFE